MQSVPSEYTLGWNTSDVNLTRGGFSGYCSPNVIRSENTPPARRRFGSRGSLRWSGVCSERRRDERMRSTLRACWLVDFAPAPSQAVSSGPKMVALQTNRLSSLWGLALHPCRRESRFGRRRSAERSGASARGWARTGRSVVFSPSRVRNEGCAGGAPFRRARRSTRLGGRARDENSRQEARS